MFKLLLIIILKQAFCVSLNDLFQEHDPKDLEIVYLPTILLNREALEIENEPEYIDYGFSAFGDSVNLKLKRNDKLLSKHFKSYVYDDEAGEMLEPPRNCHFLHKSHNSVGALSFCHPKKLHGLLFLNNSTLEIFPLEKEIHVREPLLQSSDDLIEKIPHVIKRIAELPHYDDSTFPTNFLPPQYKVNVKKASNRPVGGLTLEIAVFFDAAAYRTFSPYMNYDNTKLLDMILAYINGVQALYHHPSLGMNLELVLVRVDVMKTQPTSMPHYEGERGKLLDSFCDYQNGLNVQDDRNSAHWDMGLYVSGLDFFAYENGRKSGVTMGLATVGGVCIGKYACVIAELGTTNVFGKPYPSAGFTSVYILAHEIGHNLGMHHDSTGNNCPKEGYVMSPSRGTNGETTWSSCSAQVMQQLTQRSSCLLDSGDIKPEMDHKKFSDTPGQMYTVKKQCEILLTDKDAYMSPNQQLATICYNLQCKTPHRTGYYFAGPALEGTECGKSMYCFGGDCVQKSIPKPPNVQPGGWSNWKLGACTSGCTYKSKGYQEKRRICNNPAPINTDKGCDGNSFEVGLCKDEKICSKRKRVSITDLASDKCKEFSKLLPQLDAKGFGLQAPHEDNRLWMGCAIFCRRADSGSYYTPRLELNDLGVSPYFPDGTWCHSDSTGSYYCQQHHCLPEHFQFTKSFFQSLGEDIPIPQNAHPNDYITGGLLKYLSLDLEGKPLQTTLRPEDTNTPNEEDWEAHDYLELPKELREDVISDDNEPNFPYFM